MSLSRLTETSSAQPLHSGYLTKEPMHGHLLSRAQRRFFVLTANKLEWFVDEASVNAPKGELLLVGSRYERRARKELMVSCGDDTLVLKDDDEAALDTWEAALSRLLFDVNEPITPRTPRESRGYVGDDDQFASFSGLSVTASVDYRVSLPILEAKGGGETAGTPFIVQDVPKQGEAEGGPTASPAMNPFEQPTPEEPAAEMLRPTKKSTSKGKSHSINPFENAARSMEQPAVTPEEPKR